VNTTGGSRERRNTLATVAGVLAIVLVVVVANLVARGGGGGGGGSTERRSSQAAPAAASSDYDDPAAYDAITSTAPDQVAADALSERGAVAPQPGLRGSKKLASAAEKIARAGVSYSFTMTTFNLLGSQHTAPGGDADGYAPGRIRTDWAAALIASYGSSVVGLQEIQADQLASLGAATSGTFSFYPGTSLGGAGIPQNLAWDNRVWRPTYTGQLTIPFVGTTRPQPIVRLQNIASGREIYVINIHNSPNDRQAERNQAIAIEVAAIQQLRKDGIPVFIMGDFNERDRTFCSITGQTDLRAANGGSSGTPCQPPGAMRIDWIFGSPEAQFTGYVADQGPAVRRITDHAVVSTGVTIS